MIPDCCTSLNVCIAGLVSGMGALVFCLKLSYDVEKIKKRK